MKKLILILLAILPLFTIAQVGIGNTSFTPTTQLHINNTTVGAIDLTKWSSGSATSGLLLGIDASGNIVFNWQELNKNLYLTTNGGSVIIGNDVSVNGGDINGPGILGGSNGILAVNGQTDIRIDLDNDNNGSNQFEIRNGGNTTIFSVTEGGNLDADGNGDFNGNLLLTGNNRTIIGADNLDITTTSGLDLIIDSDNNSATSEFRVLKDGVTELFTVEENGLTTISLLGSGMIKSTAGALSIAISGTDYDGSVSNEIQNLSYTSATGDLGISSGTGITLPVATATVRGLVNPPNNTTTFLRGDATWASVPSSADNLGNHTATTTLNMSGQSIIGVTSINGSSDNITFMNNKVDDNTYEWLGFYSGGTRQGIFLYDGAWGGANSLTNEFSLSAENNNKLTLNTNNGDIALMPKVGNVGIGTTSPTFKLHVPSGYIGTDYINTSDNGVGSGVTGIMVKQGDNYHRTSNAAGVLSFLGVTSPTGDNLGNHTATTTLNMNTNNISNVNDIYATQNYGTGLVGVYSDTRYQNVWAMGTSWRLAANGTTPGNLYGIAWTHSNIGGQSKSGLSHQMLVMENGVTKVALGSGIWTNYTSYIPFIYDTDNTGYYLDPSSTSNINAQTSNSLSTTYLDFRHAGGNSGQGDNAYAIFQEGGAWSYPYPDLRIAYHTGIKLGANPSYNGIRFYNDYNMATQTFSVGDGDNNVRVYYDLLVNNAVRLGDATTDAHRLWGILWTGNTSDSHQINPNGGNFGYIGTSTYYWYQMFSRYYNAANGYYYFSDRSIKENISPISGALDKILKLEGVTYDIRKESHLYNEKDIDENYNRIGFVAQDFQKVLPKAVRTVETENGNKLLTVEYTLTVPVIVEAMKEQQKQIETLKIEIEKLKEIINCK